MSLAGSETGSGGVFPSGVEVAAELTMVDAALRRLVEPVAKAG
jgi:hypothetical protein